MTLATYKEQPEPVQELEQKDSMTGFFAVGMIINIVMIIAFFIWACRQWGKTNKRDE
jgi:hypothetical protein